MGKNSDERLPVRTPKELYSMRLLSAQGQQIALPGSTYGYDVIVRIGWLHREWRATYPEIQAELSDRIEISVSPVRYLYTQVSLPSC
jgi:hypothetical protein